MNPSELNDLYLWLAEQAIRGAAGAETEIVAGFCQRCNQIGLPIARVLALIDTLHPEFDGRYLIWADDQQEVETAPYGEDVDGRASEDWQSSVFYHLVSSGQNWVRRRIGAGEPTDFPRLSTLKSDGHTDYIATIQRFGAARVGEMDAFYSAWSTRQPGGFSDEQTRALQSLIPALAAAIKAVASLGIIGTLAHVYLGEDAGRKVIAGQIARGATETISAVIWMSDLRNFTGISDGARPDQIIPFLNDYAAAVIDAVHAEGGSVLKLIGDGVLAIFRTGEEADVASACRAALAAERRLRDELLRLDQTRRAADSPVTEVYLGLHVGEVSYGNIGSRNRLDFTVVGPAVNEASRIAALCDKLGTTLLLSDAFVAAAGPAGDGALPAGEHQLRGVARPRALFMRAGG